MSDIFQVLLPQGASLGASAPVSGFNGKAAVGALTAPGTTTEGGIEPLSFKVAFQNTLVGKGLKASPEGHSLVNLQLKDALLGEDELAVSGEILPLLPVAVEEVLPQMIELQSPELDGVPMLFSVPTIQEPPLNTEEKLLGDDMSAISGISQNLTLNYRSLSGSVVEKAHVAQALVGNLNDSAEGAELSAFTLPFSKLSLTSQKDANESLQKISENQIGFSRIASAAPQSLSLNGSAMSLDKLATQLKFNEAIGSVDANIQAKPSDAALVSTRPLSEFSQAASIALQNADSAMAPESMKMSIRFGQPGWAEQLVERAANMAGQNIKQAEVQLNPQELGPIHIKISVSQDQAAVTFAAQNAQVREAIDQTLHRLRDALESNGLELIQADVRDQPSDKEGADENDQTATASVTGDADTVDNQASEVIVSRSGIDHFV